jgi:hypothetical protein
MLSEVRFILQPHEWRLGLKSYKRSGEYNLLAGLAITESGIGLCQCAKILGSGEAFITSKNATGGVYGFRKNCALRVEARATRSRLPNGVYDMQRSKLRLDNG